MAESDNSDSILSKMAYCGGGGGGGLGVSF